jgi:hypothetical protein
VGWYESETESLGLCFQPGFRPSPVSFLGLSKNAVIVRLFGREEMVDDSRKFVGGCRDRFRSSEYSSHPAIELAQGRLALL